VFLVAARQHRQCPLSRIDRAHQDQRADSTGGRSWAMLNLEQLSHGVGVAEDAI
jgi:hypothetical protein